MNSKIGWFIAVACLASDALAQSLANEQFIRENFEWERTLRTIRESAGAIEETVRPHLDARRLHIWPQPNEFEPSRFPRFHRGPSPYEPPYSFAREGLRSRVPDARTSPGWLLTMPIMPVRRYLSE